MLPSFAGNGLAGTAPQMDIRDYLYRGYVVRTRFIMANSEVVGKSSCWITAVSGDRQFLTGTTKTEIEGKIDQALRDLGKPDDSA